MKSGCLICSTKNFICTWWQSTAGWAAVPKERLLLPLTPGVQQGPVLPFPGPGQLCGLGSQDCSSTVGEGQGGSMVPEDKLCGRHDSKWSFSRSACWPAVAFVNECALKGCPATHCILAAGKALAVENLTLHAVYPVQICPSIQNYHLTCLREMFIYWK